MSDRLKQFIQEHRQDFEANEAPDGVWEKIDSQLDLLSARPISSTWLSNYKYLAFSVSALVIAVFFVTIKLNNAAQVLKRGSVKTMYRATDGGYKFNILQETAIPDQGSIVKEPSFRKQKDPISGQVNHPEQLDTSLTPAAGIKAEEVFVKPLPESFVNQSTDSMHRFETSAAALAEKAPEVPLPARPEAIDTYEGTIYDSYTFCDVLKVYSFPGTLSLQKGKGITRLDEGNKPTVKTISCSRIGKNGDLRAVWIKGRTDGELTISVKKRFKNIYLLKADGRKIRPEAISHYYPGLGVIQEYSGKYFNLIYKYNVELILFFQDAEKGDKVVVDRIEAAITGRR